MYSCGVLVTIPNCYFNWARWVYLYPASTLNSSGTGILQCQEYYHLTIHVLQQVDSVREQFDLLIIFIAVCKLQKLDTSSHALNSLLRTFARHLPFSIDFYNFYCSQIMSDSSQK